MNCLMHVSSYVPIWYGNRVAERIIENAPASYATLFFDELIANAYDIATGTFGNFVIQSFLEHNPTRRRDCAIALLPRAKALARTMGCFVLRYSITFCEEDVQEMFAAELSGEARHEASNAHSANLSGAHANITSIVAS